MWFNSLCLALKSKKALQIPIPMLVGLIERQKREAKQKEKLYEKTAWFHR
jgi:hypothetical protein